MAGEGKGRLEDLMLGKELIIRLLLLIKIDEKRS